MNKNPIDYLKDHFGKSVNIHTFNNKKISGILQGYDVYANIYLSQAIDETFIGEVIINGSNVMYFDLQ